MPSPKPKAQPRRLTFAPIIRYTGKGKMRPEFSEVIEAMAEPWSATLLQLRKRDGETIHDAAARFVRKQFNKAAEAYRMNLDPRPFEITVVIDDVL